MDNKLLEKYAQFTVKTAVNVQKGQTLLVNCPIEAAFFARLCTKAAYEAGAKEVVVNYNDEQINRLKMEHTELDVLCDIKPWILESYMNYYEKEDGCCMLSILARDPEIYKGLDAAKVGKSMQEKSKALKPWHDLVMGGKIPWSIAAIPTEKWAAKIFGENDKDKIEKLWQAIFDVCRVSGGDPVAQWEIHVEKLHACRNFLNESRFSALHLKSANGTDVIIGLPENHLWGGAREISTTGIPYLPNVPTEEVFTAPHSHNVNGTVKSSMPYVYNGNLIEGISVRLKDGLVVEYSAEKGNELLEQMFIADEGAKRLGEIALVPANNPIRKTGLLFYNTLFDENAACHIAFGASYPDTIENGASMTVEERKEKGMNDSLIHEDIMIGTEDMDIDGINADGSKTALFRNGNWVDGLF